MVQTVIKPTVGRNVHFWPPTADATPMHNFNYRDTSQPCVGFICYVWSDKMINLSVIDQAGVQHAVTSVELIQSGEPKPPGGRFACWMDYQVGQAAKTEALQSELDRKVGAGRMDPHRGSGPSASFSGAGATGSVDGHKE